MESDRLLHNDGEDEVIVINQELIKLNLMMIGESQLEMFSKHETVMLDESQLCCFEKLSY